MCHTVDGHQDDSDGDEADDAAPCSDTLASQLQLRAIVFLCYNVHSIVVAEW